MSNYKVEVKYNSYLDSQEVGDMSCSNFESFLDFTEHVEAVRGLIPLQLKHDPQYRDIHEARMNVFVNGERIASEHYRRQGEGEVLIWHNSAMRVASVTRIV